MHRQVRGSENAKNAGTVTSKQGPPPPPPPRSPERDPLNPVVGGDGRIVRILMIPAPVRSVPNNPNRRCLTPIFHARRLPRRFGSLNGLLTWDYGGLDRLVGLTATVTHELYTNGARKTGLTWRFMGGCVWKHEESGLRLSTIMQTGGDTSGIRHPESATQSGTHRLVGSILPPRRGFPQHKRIGTCSV